MSSPSQIRSKVLNDKMSEFLTLLWQVNPTEYAAVEAKYAAFVDSLNAALRKTVTVLVKAEEEEECCDYAECDGYCDDCHQNPKCRHN